MPLAGIIGLSTGEPSPRVFSWSWKLLVKKAACGDSIFAAFRPLFRLSKRWSASIPFETAVRALSEFSCLLQLSINNDAPGEPGASTEGLQGYCTDRGSVTG